MITEMGGQDYSIEFFVSFPTIYHYVVCDDGKVPAKIVLLYGGKSSAGGQCVISCWGMRNQSYRDFEYLGILSMRGELNHIEKWDRRHCSSACIHQGTFAASWFITVNCLYLTRS